MFWETIEPILTTLLIIAGVSFALFLVFITIAVYQLRNMDIPADADFAETLRFSPLSIVLAIDMLDLSLDVLAAPISWILLDRLGLKALRNVSAVEALIPGTQIIPSLTLCWIGVRLLGLGHYHEPLPPHKIH